MPRFSGEHRLVRAILDGVAEMHRRHAAAGAFDSHDLINWLDEHRNPELNDIYDLDLGSDDVEMRADQQLGRFLDSLGQVKVGEGTSSRHITRRGGADRPGVSEVSAWQISPETVGGLARAREEWLGDRAPAGATVDAEVAPPDDWLDRISGSFKNDPAFEEVLEFGRAFRDEIAPGADGA